MKQEAQPILTIGLISSYPLHVGGVETHLLSLLRYSDKARYRFVLIGPISPELTAQAEALGARVITWISKRVTDISSLLTLRRILRDAKIDIAHFHCPRAAFMARPLTCWLNLPTTVTVQLPPYYFTGKGQINTFWGVRLYKLLESILNRRFTDKLIYASRQVMEEARTMGLISDSNTVFIGNGVNLALYANDNSREQLRNELSVSTNEQVICCVGRLDQQKGLDILLEAFSWLPPSKAKRLWLVGDGALREPLQEQARRLNLLGRVTFLGFRKDVGQLLRASDIFVLPSRFEAMPLSIIEAMAAGLPCIVSDTGENAMMIEDGVNGFVVPIEDVKALAEAMETLLDDPQRCRQMGRLSLERSANYGDDITVQRINEVYKSIAHTHQ